MEFPANADKLENISDLGLMTKDKKLYREIMDQTVIILRLEGQIEKLETKRKLTNFDAYKRMKAGYTKKVQYVKFAVARKKSLKFPLLIRRS